MAGYIIQIAIQDWKENPVTTTVKTLPIAKVKFPKITLCPPKDTYTNLNYDLRNLAENVSMDLSKNEKELKDKFIQHFVNINYQNHLDKLKNGFQEDNQFRNWYNGKRYKSISMECDV